MALVLEIQTWADWKTLCLTTKKLQGQYEEQPSYYEIYGPDTDDLYWHITILKDSGADQIDFEANYKSTFNLIAQRPSPNQTVTGSLTSASGAGSTVLSSAAGYSSHTAIVSASNWAGTTVVAEWSADNGSTWNATTLFLSSSSTVSFGAPQVQFSITANGSYRISVAGSTTNIRLRCSTYGGNAVSVRLESSIVQNMFEFVNSSMIQNVFVSTLNSSTANLGAGASFTGTSESTLGVAAIQLSLKADQPTTVQVQQSSNGTNWDIVDSYTVSSATGDGRTVQAVASYYRVVVTNTGASSTTYLRLQTCLCPTVEVLPRSLGTKAASKSLSVTIADDQTSIPVTVGDSTAVANPINFTDIKTGTGVKPKKKYKLRLGSRSPILKVAIPTGKIWYLTAWDGGAEGKMFFELIEVDESAAVTTLVDSLDSLTGWVASGKMQALTLEGTDKTEGTNSFKCGMDWSGAGLQVDGKTTKTLSPAVDWSTVKYLKIDAKATIRDNAAVALKLYQGSSSYTFGVQDVAYNAWSTLTFDLGEITAFDKTAIDKIEILVQETVDGVIDTFVYVDNLVKVTGVTTIDLDYFYSDAYRSEQFLFPTALKSTGAGKSIQIWATNLDAADKAIEVGFNGREI